MGLQRIARDARAAMNIDMDQSKQVTYIHEAWLRLLLTSASACRDLRSCTLQTSDVAIAARSLVSAVRSYASGGI